MIKFFLFILTILFLMTPCSLRADEGVLSDQEFLIELNTIKNPFEDGIPKPVIIKEPVREEAPKPIIISRPKPKPKPKRIVPKRILLPHLNLQGVIVGDGIQQAIINDQVVPLSGTINGVQVYEVTKKGVVIIFKGKKFFLKVE